MTRLQAVLLGAVLGLLVVVVAGIPILKKIKEEV